MHVKIQLMLDGQVAAEIDLNEGERVVGSAEPSKILIEDPSVSPTHAKIYQSDGSLFIADLGSATGTMVDGRKIAEPTTLRDGQSVRIGEFELQIKVLPEEIAAAAASPTSPQPAPMEETPGDDRASAMSTAKSAAAGIGKGLLGMAGASAKEAGRGARLASLKAQIEKLRRTDLRRAYAALGAKARASGLAQQACPELTAEIQALDDELTEKRKGSDAGGDAGLIAKAKAKALGAKMWAEAEMLERKINGILAAIGEKLAGNPPEDAALSAELRDIADIGLKIQALQDQFDAAYSDGSARAAFAESAGSVHREASVAASAIPSGDVGPGDGKRSKLALAGIAMGLLSVPLLFVKPLALLLAAGALIAGCLGWFMARKSGGPRFGGKLNAASVALGAIVIASVVIFGNGKSKYSIVQGLWSDDEGSALFLFGGESVSIVTPHGSVLKHCEITAPNTYRFERMGGNGYLTFYVLDKQTARMESPSGNSIIMYKLIRGDPKTNMAMIMAAWETDRQNAQASAASYNNDSSLRSVQTTTRLLPGDEKDWATLTREREESVAKMQQQRAKEEEQRDRQKERNQKIATLKAEIQSLEAEIRALNTQYYAERQAGMRGSPAFDQMQPKQKLLNMKKSQLQQLQSY